jgi:hypothetical protein
LEAFSIIILKSEKLKQTLYLEIHYVKVPAHDWSETAFQG